MDICYWANEEQQTHTQAEKFHHFCHSNELLTLVRVFTRLNSRLVSSMDLWLRVLAYVYDTSTYSHIAWNSITIYALGLHINVIV